MKIRIGVGVTQEWVEEAVPVLERAGLRETGRGTPPEGDGEYVECDYDCGCDAVDAEAVFAALSSVREIVGRSLVPHLTICFVED